MLDRVGSAELSRKNKERALDQALDAATRPAHLEGGRWAVLISLVALIFSGISLYETILKQPRPVLHVAGVMHYARDPVGGADVFAVPMTITNQGARDAVITTLNLRVAAAKVAATPWRRRSPAPMWAAIRQRRTSRSRHCRSPAHSSYTGVVLFYPSDLKNGAAKAVVDGKRPLSLLHQRQNGAQSGLPAARRAIGSGLNGRELRGGAAFGSAPRSSPRARRSPCRSEMRAGTSPAVTSKGAALRATRGHLPPQQNSANSQSQRLPPPPPARRRERYPTIPISEERCPTSRSQA